MPGTYQLNYKGTAVDGWSAKRDTFYFEVLGGIRGIEEIISSNNVKIGSDNQGGIRIMNNNTKEYRVFIYSLLGEELYKGSIKRGETSIKIDDSFLIVHIVDENFKTIKVKKIVIPN